MVGPTTLPVRKRTARRSDRLPGAAMLVPAHGLEPRFTPSKGAVLPLDEAGIEEVKLSNTFSCAHEAASCRHLLEQETRPFSRALRQEQSP
ncbi:hypothetical protein MES5069_1270037 [Mesorhizobium escarrei]|uniref:Uncharacterized protein n=1 Tax=Mesorhizobium escarrei TaxID=666018 RepID=A0ABN8JJ57_9HYPH|nr:hypothetical protein MES5069_1270037 [Mesorhizobium escarrei]